MPFSPTVSNFHHNLEQLIFQTALFIKAESIHSDSGNLVFIMKTSKTNKCANVNDLFVTGFQEFWNRSQKARRCAIVLLLRVDLDDITSLAGVASHHCSLRKSNFAVCIH